MTPRKSDPDNRRNQPRKMWVDRGVARTIGTYRGDLFDVATYNVSPGGLMAHCQPDVGPFLFIGDRVELDVPYGGAAGGYREVASVLGRVTWSAPGQFDNPRLPRLEKSLGNHWTFGIEFDRIQPGLVEALLSQA